MSQKTMLLKLQIKRALKALPHLLLTGLVMAVLVVALVIASASLRNEDKDNNKMKIDLITNGNALIETVGKEAFSNMDTAANLFDFVFEDDLDISLRRLKNGKVSAVIDIPATFVDDIHRGENNPATLYLVASEITMNTELIAELVDVVGDLLTSTEATSYAMQDMIIEYNDRVRLGEFNDALDIAAARVILLREEVFDRVKIYGESDVSFTKGYACAALVILLLLWGMSCSSILKSDGVVLQKKLSSQGVSLFYQELTRFISMFILLLLMITIIILGLIAVFPFAKGLFELVEITNVWQLVMLFVAFIPCVFLAATIIMFVFAVSTNQIGGILFLFAGTIGMGYVSGCFLPAIFLPDTLRNIGSFMPTAFMHKNATNALNGIIDIKNTGIILAIALGFFVLGIVIKSIRGKKV